MWRTGRRGRGCSAALLAAGAVVASAVQVALATPASATAYLPDNRSINDCGATDSVWVDDGRSVATPTMVKQGLGPSSFTMVGSTLFSLEWQRSVQAFDLSGNLLRSTPVPATNRDLVVGADGGIYVQTGNQQVSRYEPNGTLTKTVSFPSIVTGLSAWASPTGWRLLISTRGTDSLWDANLSQSVTTDMRGSLGTTTPDGGLLTTDGDYVRRYDAAGNLVWQLGDTAHPAISNGAPVTFLMLGGAVMDADGTTYIADGERGIWIINRDGLLLGNVPDSWLGNLTERSPLILSGGRLYFSNGTRFVGGKQNLASMAVSDLKVIAARLPSRRLGIGAGIRAERPLNYYSAGSGGNVHVTFSPFWQRQIGKLEVVTHIRGWRQVTTDDQGDVARATLTDTVVQQGLTLPVPAQPGPWEYEVQLVDRATGRALSGTCLNVSRGSTGAALDFSSLPAGSGGGGPAPARDVALQSALGTGLSRLTLSWDRIIKSDGSLDFSSYDADVQAASAEASKLGVDFEIQLGQGGPEKALVQSKSWAAAVGQAVNRWKPYVHNWEVWNEPNSTYGSATAYVNDVLVPASQAVHAADPSAKVVGGTVVGLNLSYWQGIIAAGGLASMDIIGLHPYTGHNRSLEEQGSITAILTLKRMLADSGAGSKPLWVTEHSWWSNGPYNWISQADKSARAEIWYHYLGISKWSYFLTEATWGNDGVSFSAIENADRVKPAALALMATNGILGDASVQSLPTGATGVYAFRTGCKGYLTGHDCVAVFSDEQPIDMVATTTGSAAGQVIDEYGSATDQTLTPEGLAVPVTGSVTWLVVPAGQPVSLAPAESEGPDLAVGGTATASSSSTNNPPVTAVDDDASAKNGLDWNATASWASKPGDDNPWLQVHLASPADIDRVLLMTQSLGSIVPGVRTWQVQVRPDSTSPWVTVASSPTAYFNRSQMLHFEPTRASDVRVTVTSLNWSGYGVGQKPWFWPSPGTSAASDPNSVWFGPAIIDELRVFAPGTVAQQARTATVPPVNSTPPPTTDSAAPTSSASGSGAAGAGAAAPPSEPVTAPSPSAPGSSGDGGAAPTPSPGPSPTPAPSPSPSSTAPAGDQIASTASATSLSGPANVRITAGQRVARRAVLRAANGRPIEGQAITMMTKPHSSGVWRKGATRTTDQQGAVIFTLAPSSTTDVAFTYAGSSSFRPARSQTSTVLAVLALRLRSSAAQTWQGATVTLTGSASPSATGSVVLQRLVAGSWRNVARLPLSASSCRFAYKLTAAGTYSLRLMRVADARTMGSTSPVLKITARAASGSNSFGDGGIAG